MGKLKISPYFFLIACQICFLYGCRKISISENFGSFSTVASYWYERDQVLYTFFAVRELPERLEHHAWQISQIRNNVIVSEEVVNFDEGVHAHRELFCPDGQICASFSQRLEQPIDGVKITLLYDRESPLAIDTLTGHENFPSDDTAASFSALSYGVFDASNEHLQPRIFHNFGVPRDDQVAGYGLVRRFSANQGVLDDANADLVTTARERSDFLYPADFCQTSGIGDHQEFASDGDNWSKSSFDADATQRGVCFDTKFLTKSGKSLNQDKSFARKNPILKDPRFKLETPLKSAKQILIKLHYCEGRPFSEKLIDPDYLTYQEYILGMKGRPVDLCFEVGKEREFRTDLAAHLANRLATAKTEENTLGQDFIYVVLLHENLSKEFRKFHTIIADEIYKAISSDAESISPRLTGAFVYSGTTDFRPSVAQERRIVWCPQELLPGVVVDPLQQQNCTTTKGAEIDLGVINFVAPLGPFPSFEKYQEYVKKFGDAGLARSPSLFFDTVPYSAATREEKNNPVTFFEGRKIRLTDTERLHVCFDRDGAFKLLPFLRFRSPEITAESADSIDIISASSIWNSDAAPGVYDVGITWSHPFRGGINYKAALTGKIVSVAPFRKSFKSYEQLGDPIWEQQTWDLGNFLQECERFCDHPVFDESGVYQIKTSWSASFSASCVEPRYPEYQP